MKRILITGASGFLGTHLCHKLKNTEYKAVGLFKTDKPQIQNFEFVQMDISDELELRKLFKIYKFEIVFHLAAVTPLNSIDSSDSYVNKINVKATENICKLTEEYNSLLIFTSTDLVYKEGDNLTEESALNPLTTYSKSKVDAEKIIKEFSSNYIILRTSLMYGFTLSKHRSFFDTSFEMLKQGKVVNAFSDQFRNCLFVEDSARLLIQLMSSNARNITLNFCGWEKLSRYEMAKKMAEVFQFDTNLVIPSSCDEFTSYKMVKNLGLNFDKMKQLDLVPNNYLKNLNYLKENLSFYF
ncbi:MAG: SDR family oxidoreductase [Ignavibacteria bacterium]|nr:SDR family oxidoreductase [Ignavibacteria bacterium]